MPMQVVSGRIERPTVHFEAPPRDSLESELALFIEWFNRSKHDPLLDPLLRAAICHLWFVTLHPLDDGNGRITDLALAQGEPLAIRFYAMSVSILKNRLLDGDFLQGISASQYQKVAKVSRATATRHLAFLVDASCLIKTLGGGRNTRYVINA